MKIPLAPLDYYFYRPSLYTIQFVFEFDYRLDVTRLEKALQRAGQLIPVLRARLELISDNELVFKVTDEPLSLFIKEYDEDAQSLILPIVNSPGEQLLKVSVANGVGGGFLGVSFSHMLGDGASFFMFMNTLSKIMKGEDCVSSAHLPRRFFPLSSSDFLPVTSHRLFAATGYAFRPPREKVGRIDALCFTKNDLLALKEEASEGAPATTNDALMAYLLKKYHQEVPLSEEGHLVIRCPVDYRKLFPGMPLAYFGNAVRDAVACFDPDAIYTMSLSQIAATIRQAITSVDEASVRNSLVCLDDLRRGNGIDVFSEIGCPGLLVSNLSRIDLGSIDLGSGPPVDFRPASQIPTWAVVLNKCDGVEVRYHSGFSLSH
jgi:hypothetical protein